MCSRAVVRQALTYHSCTSLVLSKRNVMYSIK